MNVRKFLCFSKNRRKLTTDPSPIGNVGTWHHSTVMNLAVVPAANSGERRQNSYSAAMEFCAVALRTMWAGIKRSLNLATTTHCEFYELLGVTPQANEQQLKAAYRKLLRDKHPDHSADQSELNVDFVQRATQAYRVLSDVKLRQIYDFGGTQALEEHWQRETCKKTAHLSQISDLFSQWWTGNQRQMPPKLRCAPISAVMRQPGSELEQAYADLDVFVQNALPSEQLPQELVTAIDAKGCSFITQAVQCWLSADRLCTQCGALINKLDALCYCRLTTERMGPHCLNKCCPQCSG